MRIVLTMVLFGFFPCLTGCSSIFHDPLQASYQSGEISQEEYARQSQEVEQGLARTSPAYWERQQTAEENRSQLNRE